MLHLAFLNQVLHRSSHVFDRHIRVDPVLVEQIDDSILRRLSEASATSLMCSGRLSSALPVGIKFEPELGGNHHLLAEGSECLTYEFFVCERAVRFSRIEESDAAFDSCADQ